MFERPEFDTRNPLFPYAAGVAAFVVLFAILWLIGFGFYWGSLLAAILAVAAVWALTTYGAEYLGRDRGDGDAPAEPFRAAAVSHASPETPVAAEDKTRREGAGADPAVATASDAATAATAPAASDPVAPAEPATDATPADPAPASPNSDMPVPGTKPRTLDAPRGEPDDLKRIRGVGPKLEQHLNALGFWHFDQIADWSDAELEWVDENLGSFRGRARRDDWRAQARDLMA